MAVPNLLGHLRDKDSKACDEVSGKKSGKRCKGDIWWRNEEVKEAKTGKNKNN